MKNLFLALTLILSTSTAFAGAPVCPTFPYDMTEEEGVVEVRSFDIAETTALTSLQQLQALKTALWYSQTWSEPTLTNGAAAVKFLKEGSEGGDLFYKVMRFKGVVYTQVLFFPGGNPYGLIFKGAKALAEQTDGDITCLK